MEQRLAGFGLSWQDTTAVQAYSVHDFHHVMSDMAARRTARSGLTWYFARPPVQGLEYEMDCRCVNSELIIE